MIKACDYICPPFSLILMMCRLKGSTSSLSTRSKQKKSKTEDSTDQSGAYIRICISFMLFVI
jgi:hypothetical protein